VAYRADIEIAVRGAQELKRLQDQVSATSKLVDELNNYLSNIGGGGIVRSINNLNAAVADTAAAFNKAALGTEEATLAARNFVSANNNLTQGLTERLALLKSITEQERRQRLGAAGIRETSGTTQLGPGPASPVGSLVGQKSPVAERIGQTLQARKEEIQLQAALLRLEEKSAAVLNEKLELQQRLNRAALAQGKLDIETVSAQQAQRQQFLAGKSGTPIQGPLAGPGAMGFPVALSLSKVEQQGLETAAKKQAILQRMAATRQDLVGLAANLQRLDQNSVVAIADAARGEVKLIELKKKKAELAAAALKTSQAETKAAVALAQQQQKALDDKRKERSGMLQNAMIGGAFPLLFGGGVGAVAGGFAGGFIPGNPMMSIVTSALGTVLDQFAAAAAQMGASLSDPITNFEKLKEANLLASKSQEFYIQKLIETGRIAEATGAIQAQIIKKIGVSGYNDLTALGNASIDLSKAWADFNLQLQAALAGPLAGLLAWLTEIVKLSTASTQQQAQRLDPAAFTEAQMKAIQKTSTLGFGGNAAAYNKELDRLSAKIVEKNAAKIKPLETTKLKDLSTVEAGIKAAEQQADIIKSAYRTGFQLQQQALDLQRQGTDLQRRVADDIFNKQQQIARLQIDNERQRQQIAIETVDLEYRRRISQEEGRVAEALAAEADLLKTRAQGEATIQNAKRLLELDITKQRRDTENYVYQLGRDIENIRRSTLNYEMQVADYRLDVERKVAAERRIENAGTTSGSVPAAVSGGKAGVTATSVAGFPITSRQGMRKHRVRGGQRMHAGTDIGTPMNTALAYSLGGVVTKATTMGGYGKILEVKLDNGVTAFAAHLNDVLVKAGEKFKPNQLLARTGQTGVGTGPHLHMEGTKGGDSTAPLPYLVLGGKKSKVTASPAASTISQLTTAESQVTARPAVPMVDAAGAGATLANLNAKDAAIRKEAVTLQEKLNQLQESAALQRLEEVARGPIDLQQRRDALDYAKADLSVVQVGNSELQERLAFEAQSLVKLQIRTDRDKEIRDNTKLQGEDRKKLVASLEEGLKITQQQIELDREALRIAQEKRFALEEANIQAQLGVTGGGLRAGFIGPAAGAFESEMLKSGNTEQATRLAELTNQLTLAQVQARGMESSVLAIGDAFGTAMTDGVASLVNGTASAEQVFAQFLDTIAQALLKAAADMIAAYIAIGIARMFAGMANSGGNAAAKMGSSPNVAAYAPLPIGFAEGGFVTGPTNAIIGEGGESEYVIPASKMQSAMSRYSRGARGEGVIAGSGGGAEGGGATAAAGPMVVDVRYSVERINTVDYVTVSQFQSGMQQAAAQGAAQGEQRTLRRLQNAPSARKRVGI
jgi:murein DD-endopeptidase MepM/ murein hydrolase activator NlpD